MIQTIYISKYLLSKSKTFNTFFSNHEKHSFLCFSKFLIKSKILSKNINHFKATLNLSKVPVTNVMLGVIEWPYIHNQWSVQKRLDAIAQHYSILSGIDANLMKFHQGYEQTLMNFGNNYENVSITLDRPKWFIREGEMVINVFHQDIRVVSIAFTFGEVKGETIVYIGAVQGIHSGVSSEESLKINRKLTKLFWGLRPKTLVIEVLKAFLKSLNVNKIYGISDNHRHHRHKYFGKKYQDNGQGTIKTNYDDFWKEHGGELDKDSGFYILSLNPAIRSLDEMPSKKRAQYRRRNAIIESINETLLLKTHGS
jgi:uncharacterized protein VirK/YbjX